MNSHTLLELCSPQVTLHSTVRHKAQLIRGVRQIICSNSSKRWRYRKSLCVLCAHELRPSIYPFISSLGPFYWPAMWQWELADCGAVGVDVMPAVAGGGNLWEITMLGHQLPLLAVWSATPRWWTRVVGVRGLGDRSKLGLIFFLQKRFAAGQSVVTHTMMCMADQLLQTKGFKLFLMYNWFPFFCNSHRWEIKTNAM